MDTAGTPSVTRYAEPPASLMDLLTAHLPYSLPLLRRLQFTRFPGGRTETTHILLASSAAGPPPPRGSDGDEDASAAAPFAAAYLDLSRGPETEIWLYASLERASSSSWPPFVGAAPALAVLARARAVRDAWPAPRALGPVLLAGALAERTRAALVTAGVVFPTVNVFDKWLLRPEALPPPPPPLPPGMRWATVRRADLGLVLSRSKVRRTERTLKLLPSASIELEDGTPIAWSFLGPDLSLTSLHCEEAYRGRGLAKAVAVKLIREYLKDHGGEGTALCSADVAPDNASSQGVCRSLGGEIAWTLSWSTIDLDSVKAGYSL